MPKISLLKTNNLYNVLTNKVMPNDPALRFLNAGGSGADKYKLFIEERLNGDKSIWDTITKDSNTSSPPLSATTSKKLTVNKEYVNLKEERKFLSRFLVALRS